MSMVDVGTARAKARRVFERRYREWAVTIAAGGELEGPLLDLPLHPPTEGEALSRTDEATAWVRAWRASRVPGVAWERRRWASIGAQDVPVRLRLDDPSDLAVLAGTADRWRCAVQRAGSLLDLAGGLRAGAGDRTTASPPAHDAVRRVLAGVVELDEADFARLSGVLAWLGAHPDSGMYVRQLPIRGIDTKWITAHRALVTTLHTAFTGRPDLGLATVPGGVRVRFLDPVLAPGGLGDVTAPVEELNRLRIRPAVVYVIENLQTIMALPSISGAVAVHGSGYAVDRLELIHWLRGVIYWGDLDSHGFAILNRLRSHLEVTSVLMDTATLLEHEDLWVPEPSPFVGDLPLLTPAEASALGELRSRGNVRLEQERIGWAGALEVLRAAAADGRKWTDGKEQPWTST